MVCFGQFCFMSTEVPKLLYSCDIKWHSLLTNWVEHGKNYFSFLQLTLCTHTITLKLMTTNRSFSYELKCKTLSIMQLCIFNTIINEASGKLCTTLKLKLRIHSTAKLPRSGTAAPFAKCLFIHRETFIEWYKIPSTKTRTYNHSKSQNSNECKPKH